MNNSIYLFPKPENEPVLGYAPGSPERTAIRKALDELYNTVTEIPIIIGGKEVRTKNMGEVVMPTENHHVLARYHKVGEKEVKAAIAAAMKAQKEWADTPWIDRASVMLKIATLISGKYRWLINAATMLGQGKTTMQAEIDSACELVDFLRYNAWYASQIYSDQPCSDKGTLNYVTYRAMEGFVFAITPFNFTSIASNLCLSPVLMGNVCIWKPSTTALLSNYILMKIYKEAGLPDGVVNFLPGSGALIGKVAFADENLAGVHFTGSTSTFKGFWKAIGQNIDIYKTYPKIVGETGGKDFIMVHKSANPEQVATAIVRGAFEFQGQKCSAASRAYVPKSMWPKVKDIIGKMLKSTTPRRAKTPRSSSAATATRALAGSSSPRSSWPRSPTIRACARRSSDPSSPSMSTRMPSTRRPAVSATPPRPTPSQVPSSPTTAPPSARVPRF